MEATSKMAIKFIFPTTKFAYVNSIQKQISHIETELLEVKNELENFKKLRGNARKKAGFVLATELMDLAHSTQTALQILKLKGVNLLEARSCIIDKNSKRGYYTIGKATTTGTGDKCPEPEEL